MLHHETHGRRHGHGPITRIVRTGDQEPGFFRSGRERLDSGAAAGAGIEAVDGDARAAV